MQINITIPDDIPPLESLCDLLRNLQAKPINEMQDQKEYIFCNERSEKSSIITSITKVRSHTIVHPATEPAEYLFVIMELSQKGE